MGLKRKSCKTFFFILLRRDYTTHQHQIMSKRAAAAPLKGHQAKKAKVEPEPVFDPKNEDLVKAVQAAQDKFAPLETEMELKLAEIEYEYENKKKPIYEERKKAIAAVPKFWSSVVCTSLYSLLFFC